MATAPLRTVSGEFEKGLTASKARGVSGWRRIGAQQQRFIIRLDGTLFAFSVLGREAGGIHYHWLPAFR